MKNCFVCQEKLVNSKFNTIYLKCPILPHHFSMFNNDFNSPKYYIIFNHNSHLYTVFKDSINIKTYYPFKYDSFTIKKSLDLNKITFSEFQDFIAPFLIFR